MTPDELASIQAGAAKVVIIRGSFHALGNRVLNFSRLREVHAISWNDAVLILNALRNDVRSLTTLTIEAGFPRDLVGIDRLAQSLRISTFGVHRWKKIDLDFVTACKTITHVVSGPRIESRMFANAMILAAHVSTYTLVAPGEECEWAVGNDYMAVQLNGHIRERTKPSILQHIDIEIAHDTRFKPALFLQYAPLITTARISGPTFADICELAALPHLKDLRVDNCDLGILTAGNRHQIEDDYDHRAFYRQYTRPDALLPIQERFVSLHTLGIGKTCRGVLNVRGGMSISVFVDERCNLFLDRRLGVPRCTEHGSSNPVDTIPACVNCYLAALPPTVSNVCVRVLTGHEQALLAKWRPTNPYVEVLDPVGDSLGNAPGVGFDIMGGEPGVASLIRQYVGMD
jgi:hypothetical protein